MEEIPPILNYADKATPNDSRRARRLIEIGLTLLLITEVALFWFSMK